MPQKNRACTLHTGLCSQANAFLFQTNPTIAAGDAKVSLDGGPFTNLATLPVVTPAGGKLVKIDLSADEMNGDLISVVFSDQAGAEWQDQIVSISTELTTDIYDLTHTAAGTPVSIVIPPPSGAYQCRVFALCYDQASQTPLDLLTAKFKITQPYYYEGKYHDIQEYDGIMSEPDDNGNRYVYRDIVWGCKLQVTLANVGIVKRGTVPAIAALDVYHLA